MLPKVYKALTESPAVFALIGNRVYRHGMAPQQQQQPIEAYVTWGAPAGDTQLVLDRVTDADTFRVNVDCWSTKDDDKTAGIPGIETLAAAVRGALEQHAVLVAYLADERDAETQKYRMSFAFDWIIGRDQ